MIGKGQELKFVGRQVQVRPRLGIHQSVGMHEIGQKLCRHKAHSRLIIIGRDIAVCNSGSSSRSASAVDSAGVCRMYPWRCGPSALLVATTGPWEKHISNCRFFLRSREIGGIDLGQSRHAHGISYRRTDTEYHR